MGKIVEFLKGKKTYIQATGIGIIVALGWAGIIGPDVVTLALGVLGAGSVASIGAKIDRANSE